MSTLSLLEVDFLPLTSEHLQKQQSRARSPTEEEDSGIVAKASRPNSDLEAGKKLQDYLESEVKDLLCVPLVDPDPFYSDKNTYVILDNKFLIYRFSGTRALCCFGPLNWLRKLANQILIHHKLFYYFIMLTILVNCVFMAMDTTSMNGIDEKVFLAIYTFEMVVKVISSGLFYPHFTYLRDSWNLLDISVIISAYVDLILQNLELDGIPGIAALRAFRVLRALKAISVIPGLKAIVSALIESVKALKDVMILTLFCLAVFALIGLQLFMGSLRNKCVKTWPPGENKTMETAYHFQNFSAYGIELPIIRPYHDDDPALIESQFVYELANGEHIPFTSPRLSGPRESWPEGKLISEPMVCQPNTDEACKNQTRGWNNENYTTWVENECNYCIVKGGPWLCANGTGGGRCWEGYTCYNTGSNPNYGYTNFDNFLFSFLAVFRLMTQDFWESLYQLTLRANGQIYILFFMIVIFIASFYLVNLILAVVAMAYEEQRQIVAEEEERRKALCLKKKHELQSMIDLYKRTEFKLQSRRESYTATLRTSGYSTPGSPNSVFIEQENISTKQKRFIPIIKQEIREKEKIARETASQLAVEVGVNKPGFSSLTRCPPSFEMINDAVNKLHQQEKHNEAESFHLPHHPTGILRSSSSTPRSTMRRKGKFSSHAPVEYKETEDKRNKQSGETTNKISIVSNGRECCQSNFEEDEQSEEMSLNSFTSRKLSVFSEESSRPRVTYAKRRRHNSNGTVVDCNGAVTLSQRSSLVTNAGLPEVVIDKAKHIEETHSEVVDYLMPLATLRPPSIKSRMSSVDLLSEDEIGELKRRAQSQVSLIESDMKDKKLKCPSCWKRLTEIFCIWNCCNCWVYFQSTVKRICEDSFFDLAIIVCIVLNTICMALEQDPKDESLVKILETANNVFTCIFVSEMIIKMIGLHPLNYFKEAWNCFDAIIVTVSLLEYALQDVPWFSVLRTFRLMRVFKLAKSWPTLNMLIKTIANSMGSLGNLTVILILVLFIFAVVGLQLFEKMYTDALATKGCHQTTTECRWHMKDFAHSFLIVFRILCGEWIETMWECMRINNSMAYLCVPVFLLVQVIGNLVMLSLFLALLLSSFSADNFSSNSEEDTAQTCIQVSVSRIKKWLGKGRHKVHEWRMRTIICCRRKIKLSSGSRVNIDGSDHNELKKESKADDIIVLMDLNNEIGATRNEEGSSNNHTTFQQRNHLGLHFVALETSKVPKAVMEASPETQDSGEPSDLTSFSSRLNHNLLSNSSLTSSSSSLSNSEYQGLQVDKTNEKTSQEDTSTDEPESCWPMECTSRVPCCDPSVEYGCCKTWWNARKVCFKIVEHSWFETFIIFMILLSSGALAFEDVYYADRKVLVKILQYADRLFTYVFVLEMVLKWVGYGFKKYFTNAWCWLDFLIVAVSLISLVASLTDTDTFPGIRSLRTLRALRPLRAMSRFQGMKVVIKALLGAIPSIFNVLLVCIIFWLIFSIMGVNLFAGKFWKCKNITNGRVFNATNFTYSTTEGNTITVDVINRTTCLELSKNVSDSIQWQNGKVNFDNAWSGYLALLQVATFKGWMDIMYDAVDITKKNEQPVFEASFNHYWYFVAFIVFGSFFTLNLFIGVIIENFNQQKKKFGDQHIFMTEEQRKYYNAMKKLGSKKPQKPIPRPENNFQAWFFDIVQHQLFEIIIMSLIVLNMVTMMLEYHGMSTSYKEVLEFVNYIFVAIFTGEAAIKMFALRHHYFKNPWNVFDFVVVILSVVGSTMSDLIRMYFVQPTLFRIIRLARIGRILRLIKGAKGIRTLLFALMMSLPSLMNIGLLLILVMFIYSIVGMSQFAYVHRDVGIDDLFNFETFANSFLCLFMISTSAGWAELLSPMLDTKPYCNKTLKNGNPNKGAGDCATTSVAVIFFVTYVIFSFLIVVNMYIAIILENFGVATEESSDPLGEDDFEMFYEVWEKFDPKATQFIAYTYLSDLVDSLEHPLRVPKPNTASLTHMDLPMVMGDRLHCLDVLFALTKRVLGESEELENLRSSMEEKFMASNPSKISYEPITTTLRRKQEERSAIVIQKWWRSVWVLKTVRRALFVAKEPSISDNDDDVPENPSLRHSIFSLENQSQCDLSPQAQNNFPTLTSDFRNLDSDTNITSKICDSNEKQIQSSKENEDETMGIAASSALSGAFSQDTSSRIPSSSSLPHFEEKSASSTPGSNTGVVRDNTQLFESEERLDISASEMQPTDSDAENNNDEIQRNLNETHLSNILNNQITVYKQQKNPR